MFCRPLHQFPVNDGDIRHEAHGLAHVAGHGETGLTVSAGDPLLLAQGLVSLIEVEEQYARFSANAKARFEREFTSEIMSQRLDMLYKEATVGAFEPCI